jgi:hypothetical protein
MVAPPGVEVTEILPSAETPAGRRRIIENRNNRRNVLFIRRLHLVKENEKYLQTVMRYIFLNDIWIKKENYPIMGSSSIFRIFVTPCHRSPEVFGSVKRKPDLFILNRPPAHNTD